MQRSLLALYRMIARFHLYYEPASLLPGLIAKVSQRLSDWMVRICLLCVTDLTSRFTQAKGGPSNSLVDQSLSDIAATEIADQLHIIKNNDVLIVFLRGCVVLKGARRLRRCAVCLLTGIHTELKFSEVATPLKLQAVLYNMSAPGGPFYAPREVRLAAYYTLKILYPVRNQFGH